ncbi:MAG: PDZ domain-containing protein [Pyrinomonadaceae bacterium]
MSRPEVRAEHETRKTLPQAKSNKAFLFAAVLFLALAAQARAQRAAPPQAIAPVEQPTQRPNAPLPPEVVIVVNQLTGARLLAWLHRSGVEISLLDEQSLAKLDAHSSIVAGLALNGGQHVVAHLPRTEAELAAAAMFQGSPPAPTDSNNSASLNLKILLRNDQQLHAKYLGFDAGTGLSLLQTDVPNLNPAARDASENELLIGQRVRLLAPAPAVRAASDVSGTLRLRFSEVEGKLTEIVRAPPTGRLLSLIVRVNNPSPMMAGGVALNDANQMIGLIERVDAGTASLMPIGAVRRAANRVVARRSNFPAPFLGVQGEPLANVLAPQLLRNGWTNREAFALIKNRNGVLLTSIVPNTAAARVGLRPGDVITRLNNINIRSVKEFSQLLNDTVDKTRIRFTVLRAGSGARSVPVDLSKAFNPGVFLNSPAANAFPGGVFPGGLETVTLSPRVAGRFGARGGLLVVSVQPQSAAFRAGLRPDDIIEAVDNRLLSGMDASLLKPLTEDLNPIKGGASVSLTVVRNTQKLAITLPIEKPAAP